MSSRSHNNTKVLDWLEKEKQKDDSELLADKRKFIEEIRKFRKSELTNSDEIKLTLWQKIKKTLGFLEKLALIADASQNLFTGRATVIFELPNMEFRKTQIELKKELSGEKFKIDISGTEFIFLMSGVLQEMSSSDDKEPF